MKKVIYLLVIVGVIVANLFGCTKNTTDISKPSINHQVIDIKEIDDANKPSEIPFELIEPDNNDLLNIYLCIYEQRKRMPIENEIAFENFIKDNFDYSIDIIYLNTSDDKWIDELQNTDNDGIIYFPSTHYYEEFKKANILIPLNEYVNKNALSHFTYQSGLELLSDSNDYFYGIPSRYTEYYTYKMYQQPVLDQLSLPVPSTIAEFTNLADRVKDQGGYVRCYQDNVYSFFGSFSDVFTAFGSHINISNGGSISYNPIKKEYELPILTDEFFNALTYIKKLKDEDKILPYSYEAQLIGKLIASSNSIMEYEGAPEYELYEKSMFLIGEYDEYLINTESSLEGFAILKGSYNIDSKISFIFDELFNNDAMMLSLLYGRAGYNFNIVDNQIIVSLHPDGNGYSFLSSQFAPNIRMDYYDNPFPVYYKRWSDDVLVPQSVDISEIDYRDIYADNMFYNMNLYVKEDMKNKYLQSLNLALYELYTGVFQNDESIENAILKYRQAAEQEGAIEYIRMLNEQ